MVDDDGERGQTADRIELLDTLHPCVLPSCRAVSLRLARPVQLRCLQTIAAMGWYQGLLLELLDSVNNTVVIARPVELECAGACFCGHPGPILRRATELLHALSKSVDIARFNQEPFDAVADDRSRRWRDHAGKTAGQRLVGDHGGALEERGKHEHISRGHPCRNVSVRDSS